MPDDIRRTRIAAEDTADEAYRTRKATEKATRHAADTARATAATAAAAQATAAASQAAAEHSARAADTMAQAAADQRHYQFQMWRQSPNGQAFEAWTPGATTFIQALDAKDAWVASEWKRAWEAAEQSVMPLGMSSKRRLGLVIGGSVVAAFGIAFFLIMSVLSALVTQIPGVVSDAGILFLLGGGAMVVVGYQQGRSYREYRTFINGWYQHLGLPNPPVMPMWAVNYLDMHQRAAAARNLLANAVDILPAPQMLPATDFAPIPTAADARWPVEVQSMWGAIAYSG